MDQDSIEHIVLFMREAGIDAESLLSKRAYGGAGRDKGVWRNGNGVLVKKMCRTSDGGNSSGEDVATKPRRLRKFQRVKEASPVEDDGIMLDATPQSSSVPLTM